MKQGSESAEAFEELVKLGKNFKFIDAQPNLMTVPATSHLFDLAGTQIKYPSLDDIKNEGVAYQVKGGISSYIGSFFGRWWTIFLYFRN